MLSGMKSFLISATFILVLSWLCASGIWLVIDGWLTAVFSSSSPEKVDEELPLARLQSAFRKESRVRSWTIYAALMTAVLWMFRPRIPYSHLSGAVPFTFLGTLLSKSSGPHQHQLDENPFPFPELLQEEFWEPPRDHFKGWMPGASLEEKASARPTWVSESLPVGFERWKQKETGLGDEYTQNADEKEDEKEYDKEDENEDENDENENGDDGDEKEYKVKQPQKNYYDPVNDPLRITNLDSDIVAPLAEALRSRDIPISHIVLVMMESARKDIFPFKSGSHLHQEIMSSHENSKAGTIEKVDAKLAQLTPIAEMLTGEAGGFPVRNETNSQLWKDTAEDGMGGINIQGILTGSSLSFKSAVMNYCGVGPIPVDFMSEVHSDIYQPCIMHIFDLFNQLKNSTTNDKSSGHTSPHDQALDREWTSVFLQSITGQFDDQDDLNKQMGFKKSIYREEISSVKAEHYHDGMEVINYFG